MSPIKMVTKIILKVIYRNFTSILVIAGQVALEQRLVALELP